MLVFLGGWKHKQRCLRHRLIFLERHVLRPVDRGIGNQYGHVFERGWCGRDAIVGHVGSRRCYLIRCKGFRNTIHP